MVRGWIRIAEAFIAILLITGALLVIINQSYVSLSPSSKVYETEISILREIELNDDLRRDILNVVNIPVEDKDANFPLSVKEKINESLNSLSANLNCSAKICSLTELCVLDKYPKEDTYAQQVAITANMETYAPRQLKLFCW